MSDAIVHDYVAYSPGAEAAFFIKPSAGFSTGKNGTPLAVTKLSNSLDIVPWGEDNRFPQNITRLMSACSIGLAGLDWKMRALWGGGIMPVRVTGYEDDGKTEIIKPLLRTGADKQIWKFIESRQFKRFYMEFLQDWVWFGNCWPEGILSKDGKSITGWVHQESCDARYQQMNEQGQIKYTYLSKMWGLTRDQFKTFDKDKTVQGIIQKGGSLEGIDKKYISMVRTIDMYNALDDLNEYSKTLQADSRYKSFILPVNYPSPNQPYYQVPTWDGARVAGWIDIATKIPLIIATMLNKTFSIKYHIEIPEAYFEKRHTKAGWLQMNNEDRRKAKRAVIQEMEDFLKGADRTGSAFISYFDSTDHEAKEYNRIKITELPGKFTIDKEMLASAGINTEILVSMNINPDVLGASVPGGAYGGNKGGSNIREGKLVYDSMLNLERQVVLEPLYLTRDFNQWDEDIQFRFRDTILTTLDQNTGTKKVIS